MRARNDRSFWTRTHGVPFVVDFLFLFLLMTSVASTGCGKHLVQKKPRVQAKLEGETFDQTALVEQALQTGDLESLRALVKEGFDLLHRFEKGRNLLMRASELGHTGMVRWLLDEGLDPELLDDEGLRAIDLASKPEIQFLLQGGLEGQMLEAAREKDLEKFEQALSAGAQINYQDKGGWTALMIVAQNGDLRIFRVIARMEGLNPNLRNSDGQTALKVALESGQAQIARFLRERLGGVE